MDEFIVLNVNRQKGIIKSIDVSLGDLNADDSVKITRPFIQKLEEHWDISDIQEGPVDDRSPTGILVKITAKAIALRQENLNKPYQTSTSDKFDLGNPNTFPEGFLGRVHELTLAGVTLWNIDAYLDSDSKVEDLDWFYNTDINFVANYLTDDQIKDIFDLFSPETDE